MHNNLDYLYTQLNELNSKIGSTYNYIDSNILSDSKINELNLKCDYMIARADKIQAKIDILESQDPDSHVDIRDDSNIIFIISSIIFAIIILIYAITTIL